MEENENSRKQNGEIPRMIERIFGGFDYKKCCLAVRNMTGQ